MKTNTKQKKSSEYGPKILNFVMNNKVIFIVIILGIVLSLISDVFLTVGNMLNVLRQICVSTVVACGFAFVLASGNIDLSVGSVVGLSGVVMAMLMVKEVAIPLAILAGLGVALVAGFMNGFLISFFKLPAFIITLSTMQIFRGTIYLLTKMAPIQGLPDDFLFFGQGYWLGIPVPVYIMVVVIAITWFIMNYTKFGRYVLAVGGNQEASRVSGINVRRIIIGVYLLVAVCAACAGVVLTARTASAQTSAGKDMEQDVIAACVIGGTSLNGGTGKIIGAFFGCILVGMISNGFNLMGLDPNWQVVGKGVLILIAVLLDGFTAKLKLSTTKTTLK